MVRSCLCARGAVAIVVLVLFLGCTGLSLLCPMTAAHAGSKDAAAQHDQGRAAGPSHARPSGRRVG